MTLRLGNGKNILVIFSQERYETIPQAIINPSIISPDSGYQSKMLSFILLNYQFVNKTREIRKLIFGWRTTMSPICWFFIYQRDQLNNLLGDWFNQT